MAHPYKQHAADKVAKAAAQSRVKGYAKGGSVKGPPMKGGADSGVGRLDKVKAQKNK